MYCYDNCLAALFALGGSFIFDAPWWSSDESSDTQCVQTMNDGGIGACNRMRCILSVWWRRHRMRRLLTMCLQEVDRQPWRCHVRGWIPSPRAQLFMHVDASSTCASSVVDLYFSSIMPHNVLNYTTWQWYCDSANLPRGCLQSSERPRHKQECRWKPPWLELLHHVNTFFTSHDEKPLGPDRRLWSASLPRPPCQHHRSVLRAIFRTCAGALRNNEV